MKRLLVFALLFLLVIPMLMIQYEVTAQVAATATALVSTSVPAPTLTQIPVVVFSTTIDDPLPTPGPDVNSDSQAAPHFVSSETYVLVWVERANLRTEPSTEEGRVVDIALAGETFTIIGIFYPEENSVEDPDSDLGELVFDDENEREVWYLVQVPGGAAWIFGGIVLVANIDDYPTGLRNLTPEEEARLQQEIYEISGTIPVRNSVRIRTGPSTDYRVIDVASYPGRVTVIGRNEYGTWAYIDYNGTQGWVSSFLLGFPPNYQFHLVPIIP